MAGTQPGTGPALRQRAWNDYGRIRPANGESRILLPGVFNEANIPLPQEAAGDQDKQAWHDPIAGLLYETHIVIGHVGDSRAYLVEEDFISLLTEDHSVRQMVNAGTLSLEACSIPSATF